MSLGLLSGYGSDSGSEAEEDVPTGGRSEGTNSVHDRLKLLAASSLALPPPPPPPPEPEPEPLPNPLAHKSKKQKTIPGMSKKEMEMMMKNAKWLDIVTEEVDEESKPEFDYNTPLPFSATQAEGEAESSQESESDYLSYVAEYQNYMAASANLMAGKEKSDQLAEAAAAEAGGDAEAQKAEHSGSGQLWDEYMTKYQAWYSQYGSASAGGSAGTSSSSAPALKQKSFEELLEQDRQLEEYFNSEPANEYNTQRDAFKSSFRGTRRYRMLNGTNYNPRHFNNLSSGAKKFAELYPKQKSVFVDKDAYIADKDLPENQDIKSNKQRKKDKWFQGMIDKKKGCKKCGFVFCRCYGWEFKPSHVK